jgi:hypothetical protein
MCLFASSITPLFHTMLDANDALLANAVALHNLYFSDIGTCTSSFGKTLWINL